MFYDNYDSFTGCKLEPFDYEYEDGKVIIDHKHPHSKNNKHIYHL